MSDSKISALTGATTPLAGTEVLPVVQSGTTKQVAVSDLTAGRAVSASTVTTTGNFTAGNVGVAASIGLDTVNSAGGGSFGTQFGAYGALASGDSYIYTAKNIALMTDNAASVIKFAAAGNAEIARIDSTGLLVGATSQATGFSTFAQGEVSGTNGGFIIDSTAGNICRLIFTKGNASGNEGLVRYDTSDYSLQFWTNATHSFSIDDNDNLVPKVAAKGINFTANTPAAGMTSQLLNWYEEGTFTPTVSGVSLAASSGYWVRSGKMVFVYLDCTWPTTSDATPVNFRTLPFNVVTGGGCNSAFNTRSVAMVGVPGSTTADGVRLMTQVASADVTNAQMSTHRIQLAGWYNAT